MLSDVLFSRPFASEMTVRAASMKIQLGFLDQKSPACVLPCPAPVITNQESCHYKSVGNFSPPIDDNCGRVTFKTDNAMRQAGSTVIR